jgi:hypothetical protein
VRAREDGARELIAQSRRRAACTTAKRRPNSLHYLGASVRGRPALPSARTKAEGTAIRQTKSLRAAQHGADVEGHLAEAWRPLGRRGRCCVIAGGCVGAENATGHATRVQPGLTINLSGGQFSAIFSTRATPAGVLLMAHRPPAIRDRVYRTIDYRPTKSIT